MSVGVEQPKAKAKARAKAAAKAGIKAKAKTGRPPGTSRAQQESRVAKNIEILTEILGDPLAIDLFRWLARGQGGTAADIATGISGEADAIYDRLQTLRGYKLVRATSGGRTPSYALAPGGQELVKFLAAWKP